MPALSMFFGIIIRMQSERDGKHNKAHIHALYAGNELVLERVENCFLVAVRATLWEICAK